MCTSRPGIGASPLQLEPAHPYRPLACERPRKASALALARGGSAVRQGERGPHAPTEAAGTAGAVIPGGPEMAAGSRARRAAAAQPSARGHRRLRAALRGRADPSSRTPPLAAEARSCDAAETAGGWARRRGEPSGPRPARRTAAGRDSDGAAHSARAHDTGFVAATQERRRTRGPRRRRRLTPAAAPPAAASESQPAADASNAPPPGSLRRPGTAADLSRPWAGPGPSTRCLVSHDNVVVRSHDNCPRQRRGPARRG